MKNLRRPLTLLLCAALVTLGGCAQKPMALNIEERPYSVALPYTEDFEDETVDYVVDRLPAYRWAITKEDGSRVLECVSVDNESIPDGGAESPSLLIGNQEWENYKVSFDFKVPKGSQMLFTPHADTDNGEAPGQHNRWVIRCSGNGIITYQNPHADAYVVSSSDVLSTDVFHADGWNTLTVETSYASIIVSLNGTELVQLFVPYNAHGRIGLGGYVGCMFDNIRVEECPAPPSIADKPVIYLYPTEETLVSVDLDFNGRLTSTYPAYRDGWTVLAHPDGTLTDPATGREYYCLYWEGVTDVEYDLSRGFVVPGEDTAAFLENALATLGLTEREANEFIIYWLPRMEGNAYNLITFQTDAYTENAPLTVTPAPDSVLRVFMAWKPLDAPIEIEPQELHGFERQGFTVIEWGGSELE